MSESVVTVGWESTSTSTSPMSSSLSSTVRNVRAVRLPRLDDPMDEAFALSLPSLSPPAVAESDEAPASLPSSYEAVFFLNLPVEALTTTGSAPFAPPPPPLVLAPVLAAPPLLLAVCVCDTNSSGANGCMISTATFSVDCMSERASKAVLAVLALIAASATEDFARADGRTSSTFEVDDEDDDEDDDDADDDDDEDDDSPPPPPPPPPPVAAVVVVVEAAVLVVDGNAAAAVGVISVSVVTPLDVAEVSRSSRNHGARVLTLGRRLPFSFVAFDRTLAFSTPALASTDAAVGAVVVEVVLVVAVEEEVAVEEAESPEEEEECAFVLAFAAALAAAAAAAAVVVVGMVRDALRRCREPFAY